MLGIIDRLNLHRRFHNFSTWVFPHEAEEVPYYTKLRRYTNLLDFAFTNVNLFRDNFVPCQLLNPSSSSFLIFN